MQTSLFRVETRTSPPVKIQDAQAHLRSQRVQLRFPVINGGVIWNRPVAVVLRRLDGEEKIVPIFDVTRIVMFTLAGLFFTTMLVRIFFRGKRTRS